jgi:phage major head subunit gpT-like protein
MILNRTAGKAALSNFRAIVFSELLSSPLVAWFRQLFMVIQSSTPEETFHFLRGVPRMREWLGDRKIKNISEVSFKVAVKKWESTISILREDVMFDKLGQVRVHLNQLGQAYPLHLTDYAIDLILGGFTANSYDGQFFFDTDHPNYNGGTWSNRTTEPLSPTSWTAAKQAPTRIREVDGGRYMGITYDLLLYGPNSAGAVDTLFGTRELAGGGTNIYYNQIPAERRIMVPELGDTGKWFLFDTKRMIKPFILQIARSLEFTAMDSPDDWPYFNREELLYGLSSMDNAAYGLPELAYGSTNGEAV